MVLPGKRNPRATALLLESSGVLSKVLERAGYSGFCFVFSFLASMLGFQDLSSPTRYRTQAPGTESPES